MTDTKKEKRSKAVLVIIIAGIALLVIAALASYAFLEVNAGPDIIDTPVYDFQKAELRGAAKDGHRILSERDPDHALGAVKKGVIDIPSGKLPPLPRIKYGPSGSVRVPPATPAHISCGA